MDFTIFDFEKDVIDGLHSMGFNEPTPVQQQAIPIIMNGRDLIASAQTGTGKTAAFLLPVINNLVKSSERKDKIQSLIIVPTRELALQIDQNLEGFSYFTPLSSIAVYGGGDGADFNQERKALEKGAEIIIATPGRLLSHMNLGYVDFSHLKFLILDEADRMLDMGFHEDILRIVRKLPTERQTLLFSATMPPKIRGLANTILKEPEQVSIALSKPAEGVLQACYHVKEDQKIPLSEHLLIGESFKSIIVFASTKRSVKLLASDLERLKYSVKAIHSDLEQSEREQVLQQFRNKRVRILVATDVMSRGIDIEAIDLVVNYDVPNDAEDYVHRVGRTARAAATGMAITFVTKDDMYKLKRIEQLIGYQIRVSPLPPTVGVSPDFNNNENSEKGGYKRNKNFRKKRTGSKPARRND
ncbi:MAG: DEAD/DEAH box helicase [Bacteroidia bacterium]